MPRMSETRRLSESATVRVSADELLVIREKAARAGTSIGGYFRAAALERRAPTHAPELLRGLADIGRLCGLLQTALQKSDIGALRTQVAEMLAAARTVANELRRR
jgi:hypothetical protein